MQKEFTADININTNKSSTKIVRIIPFSDRDKIVAKTLEEILNHHLTHDELVECERDDSFKRMTYGIL